MADIKGDDFIGQRQRRIDKVEQLRALGMDPYPAHSQKDLPNSDITERFEELKGRRVTVTGRLVSWRDHGKLIFADLQDQSGSIQLWITDDKLIDPSVSQNKNAISWEHRNLIDPGDHIQATGEITMTTRGQISLAVTELVMLAKSIRPMPHSIPDKETTYRRRYLDLTLNKDHRELFRRKAAFWHVQRRFLESRGFMEVEVPVLEHVTGGADARPFVTHHNDLGQDFYLRISTELYQKRLIGGGFEKIFTIAPNFRNEGLSDEHLQEYYQCEWYWAYADYRDNMRLVQDLFREIAEQVYHKTTFTSRGHTFDLGSEWQEIDYVATIKERHSIDIFQDTDEMMISALRRSGIVLEGSTNRNRLIDNLWKVIRRDISGPAFLINEPAFMSPLAKSRPDDKRLTERFHVVIGGSELGNGYTEINDPQEQLEKFVDQQAMREKGDDEAQMLDIDFVEMLEYGMPPTSGYGQSERIFWFLEDVTAREGTFFPQLRHEVDTLTKEIYEKKLTPLGIQLEKNPVETKPASTRTTAVLNEPTSVSTLGISRQPTASGSTSIDRATALDIVNEHIANKNLVKHCIAVEGAMEALARHFGESEELWGLAGLLHDADWEKTADNPGHHTRKTLEWIAEKGGVDPSVERSILAHNFMNSGEPQPSNTMEWSLACCDELTGLITASCLITPEKKLSLLTIPSIMKKFRSKNFAAAVVREDISRCEGKLGIPLEQFIEIVLAGMTTHSEELGL